MTAKFSEGQELEDALNALGGRRRVGMREAHGTHSSCHSTAQMSWVRCADIFRDMPAPAADAPLLPLLLKSVVPAHLCPAQPAWWELVPVSCSWAASVQLLGACRLNLAVDAMQRGVFFPAVIKQISLICSEPQREFPSHSGSGTGSSTDNSHYRQD